MRFYYKNQLFFLSPAICLNEIWTMERKHNSLSCLKLIEHDTSENAKSGSIPNDWQYVENSLEKYPKHLG